MIVYEREDGTIDENDMEELPYDINQDLIHITDEDYGIFYLDVQDNPKKLRREKDPVSGSCVPAGKIREKAPLYARTFCHDLLCRRYPVYRVQVQI